MNLPTSAVVGLSVWATAADADIIVDELLGEPGRFHRTATHTLLATVIGACIVAMVLRRVRGARFWPTLGLLTLTYASHLWLDLFVVGPRDPVLGPTHPLGIPVLWPMTQMRIDAGPLVIPPGTLAKVEAMLLMVAIMTGILGWSRRRLASKRDDVGGLAPHERGDFHAVPETPV